MRPSSVIVASSLAFITAFVPNLPAENLPEKQPALIGSGPSSLVNLIDTGKLILKGQRDGWVMFDCLVLDDGLVRQVFNMRKSEGADALKAEVSKAILNTRFVPAVYNHKHTYAFFRGTAIFAVVNGKPHLRVFANQELDELKRHSDFIAPQIVAPDNAKYFGWSTPGHAAYLGQGGFATVRHSVDASGKTTDVKVLSESTTGEKFGQAALEGIRRSVYLPAYRNGKPTTSTLTYEVRFGW